MLEPADQSYLELSDSTTMPEGDAAPPPLEDSSRSTEEPTSETSPGEHEWRRRNKKRRVAAAIHEFRKMYQTLEFVKLECKRLKLQSKIDMMNEKEENEERYRKFMLEQQAVMAKIITDAVKEALGRRPDSPAD